MKQRAWMLILAGMISTSAYADGATDMIPELKDIERIAAEQEAAIKTQSDALAKSQKEKEAAEKAALEAIEKQKALKTVDTSAPASAATTESKPKVVVKKVYVKPSPPPTPKVDPWLAQERRYTFP